MMQNFEKDPKMNWCATYEQVSAEAFNKMPKAWTLHIAERFHINMGFTRLEMIHI